MKIERQRSIGGTALLKRCDLPLADAGSGAFTLLELLVVMGVIATLSFFLIAPLTNAGRSASLQSAQSLMANLITLARTNAMANGQSSRIVIDVDPTGTDESRRYLRYLVVQLQGSSGWETITETFLPDNVYVVPGNFGALPAGLFASGAVVPWTKVDGSDLRSTALRSNQITTEIINNIAAEQWVGITLSAAAGTLQSGDIILTVGHRRAPGSYRAGESPVELENPANVRGLTLSAYGLPTLINTRTSF